MAKSKSFFGLRKGSTKTLTLSVLKGQQITKDRVTDVANPKTQGQMRQRMLFANALKFYKHGVAAFFKFAFENKKPLESDYNAFMRLNSKNACAVSYPNYKDNAYPAFGLYQLTQGSLVSPIIEWSEDSEDVILVDTKGSGSTQIGNFCYTLMDAYPTLMVGDIVTILIVHTSLDGEGVLSDSRTNRWDMRQFVIDPNDTRSLANVLGILEGEDGAPAVIRNIGGEGFSSNFAKGAAVIFSRNTPSGLKVSDSFIIGNGIAQQFIEQGKEEQFIKAMATTWGAADKAILQGSLAE